MIIEINELRVNLMCFECLERFYFNDIKIIFNDDILMVKYDEFIFRRILVVDFDCRWCLVLDCGFVVIVSGCVSCSKL